MGDQQYTEAECEHHTALAYHCAMETLRPDATRAQRDVQRARRRGVDVAVGIGNGEAHRWLNATRCGLAHRTDFHTYLLIRDTEIPLFISRAVLSREGQHLHTA